VIELLHGYFRIAPEDDARTRREKVIGKVLGLDCSLEDTLPYLFALLGLVEGDDPLAQMEAQLRRRRTHEAIKRLVLRESVNQPLLVLIEDLHWIDSETQALLRHPTAALCLHVAYRFPFPWRNSVARSGTASWIACSSFCLKARTASGARST
jgi:hypothetical protein